MSPHRCLLPREQWSSVCPRRDIQLQQETRYPKRISSYSLRCLLLNPAVDVNLNTSTNLRPPVSPLVVWLVSWLAAQSCKYYVNMDGQNVRL